MGRISERSRRLSIFTYEEVLLSPDRTTCHNSLHFAGRIRTRHVLRNLGEMPRIEKGQIQVTPELALHMLQFTFVSDRITVVANSTAGDFVNDGRLTE